MRPASPRASISRVLRILIVGVFLASAGCAALKECAYEGFGRDSWQQPEKVVKALAIEPGDHVADLGAGSGYFTFRLAEAVGPTGRVYAVDIDPEMIAILSGRVEEEGYNNVEVILAEPGDPRLPEASIDLLFTCNVYHHMEDRSAYFSRVARSLKTGGRVAIIDFSGESWFAWLTGHATPAEVIEQEMRNAGYTLSRTVDFLPKQVFLAFTIS